MYDHDTVDIKGLDLLRWLAIIAPQRNPLKGHMEKVHGKSELRFGQGVLKPTEIVKRQSEAMTRDRDIYEYRRWARDFGQSLSLGIYNLLIDDGQDDCKSQRRMLDILSNFNGMSDANKQVVEDGVKALDYMLDDLVEARYKLQDSDIESVVNLADVCSVYSDDLSVAVLEIVKQYNFLRQQETAYQAFADTDYSQSKNDIEGSVMSLLKKQD